MFCKNSSWWEFLIVLLQFFCRALFSFKSQICFPFFSLFNPLHDFFSFSCPFSFYIFFKLLAFQHHIHTRAFIKKQNKRWWRLQIDELFEQVESSNTISSMMSTIVSSSSSSVHQSASTITTIEETVAVTNEMTSDEVYIRTLTQAKDQTLDKLTPAWCTFFILL